MKGCTSPHRRRPTSDCHVISHGSDAMKLLVPSTVLLLMVSVGMSLNWTQFLANWRRLSLATWGKLLVATFIVPPIVALALGSLLPLNQGAVIGLFLIAVAPGAPLMTRNVAKRGFDMELAASYQLWGAFLTPIMIPLLVGVAGWVYGAISGCHRLRCWRLSRSSSSSHCSSAWR